MSDLKSKLIQEVEEIKKEALNTINIPEDHQEKNNKDIAEANEKLKSLSNKQRNTETVLYKDEDRILHKRSNEDYKKIWKAFLENEEEEFKKKLGYGKKTIKKIGYKKFIDAMDWRDASDVSKYKTDVMHVVVCPVCKNEFGLYEQNVGLCHKCLPNYEMDRFWTTYGAVAKKDISEADSMVQLFFAFNEFREMYKIKTNEEQIKLMIKAKFSGMDTFRFVMEAISAAESSGTKLEDFINMFRLTCEQYVYKEEDIQNLKLFTDYMRQGVSEENWETELKDKLYKELK